MPTMRSDLARWSSPLLSVIFLVARTFAYDAELAKYKFSPVTEEASTTYDQYKEHAKSYRDVLYERDEELAEYDPDFIGAYNEKQAHLYLPDGHRRKLGSGGSDPFAKLSWVLKDIYLTDQAQGTETTEELKKNMILPDTKMMPKNMDMTNPRDRTAATFMDESFLQVDMASGKVTVDVVFDSMDHQYEVEELLAPLGFETTATFDYVTSGRIPIVNLPALGDMAAYSEAHVIHVRASMYATNTGSFTSEGDASLFADVARETFGVSGEGIRIGTLSDSFDCFQGAAGDIETNDLPPLEDLIILDDSLCQNSSGAIDEGRAMMQIIHDVAPGVSQAFHTAAGGMALFATGILALADEGACDIIVDDIIYFAEPFFQNGIIAQAAEQVAADGVPYFSAVGNNGRNAWEETQGFKGSGIFFFNGNVEMHQFRTTPSGDPIIFERIAVRNTRRRITMIFQWDEPAASASGPPGSPSDLEIFIGYQGEIVEGAEDANIGGDPLEVISFVPRDLEPNGSDDDIIEVDFLIGLFAGPPPRHMKWVSFGDVNVLSGELPPTAWGHSNTPSVAAVGASNWPDTPAFNVTPPVVTSYSTTGGTPILIDNNGTRLARPIVPQQPRFVGPDNGANTFFGRRDPQGVFRFAGTSAAAPHVAAVGALMLEMSKDLEPSQLFRLMEETAVDMDDGATSWFDFGFDLGTGHGLVNALDALQKLETDGPGAGECDPEGPGNGGKGKDKKMSKKMGNSMKGGMSMGSSKKGMSTKGKKGTSSKKTMHLRL